MTWSWGWVWVSCGRGGVREGVRAWVVAGGGGGQSSQEVGPAGRVLGGLFGWQVAVFDGDAGAFGDGGEGDLHGAGAWGQYGGSGVSPGDQQPVWWVELEIAAPYGHAV